MFVTRNEIDLSGTEAIREALIENTTLKKLNLSNLDRDKTENNKKL